MNPGQSVKDRAALFIIQDAVRRGRCGRAARWSRARPATPASASPSSATRSATAPSSSFPRRRARRRRTRCGCSARRARRGAGRSPTRTPTTTCTIRSAWPRRWPRPSPTAPSGPTSSTTSPTARPTSRPPAEEIWADTRRQGRRLRVRRRLGRHAGRRVRRPQGQAQAIQIALADVPGAALYSYYTSGELKAEGSSITEGIGQGRITKNIEGAVVDRAYLIPDAESVADRASSCWRRRGCAWAARAASTSPAPSGSPGRWARATPSSRCCATTARATSPSSSTPSSCIEEPAGARLARRRAPAAAEDVRRSRQGVGRLESRV